MKFINLTPHVVKITCGVNENFTIEPPSGKVARVEMSNEAMYGIG